MTRRIYWVVAFLAVMIVGFVAFQIYLHIDMKNFKKEIAGSPKVKTETTKTPSVVFSDEKPEDVPGFEWVKHGDHWDKVPINKPIQPIEHTPVQIVEVSNENPNFLSETEEERNLPRYDPFEEDFWRVNYSKEELKGKLEGKQNRIDRIETVDIPEYEKFLNEYKKFLQNSDYEGYKKGFAKVESIIKQRRFEVENHKKMMGLISKVLDEEESNEK